MALFLFRFSYAPEAWAALIENPQDRRDMLASRIFGTFGGQLQGFWYAFGEQDGFALVELPDAVSAAAASAAVAATGSFRSLEATVLLTADEMVRRSRRRASSPTGRPATERQSGSSRSRSSPIRCPCWASWRMGRLRSTS